MWSQMSTYTGLPSRGTPYPIRLVLNVSYLVHIFFRDAELAYHKIDTAPGRCLTYTCVRQHLVEYLLVIPLALLHSLTFSSIYFRESLWSSHGSSLCYDVNSMIVPRWDIS